jgi:hypothetical protein
MLGHQTSTVAASPGWYRDPSRKPGYSANRAAVVSLSAAAVILLAACSAGSKTASPPLSPSQALLAAATQAQQATSVTETLRVDVSGASSSTTTGTIQVRLKPTLLAYETLNLTSGSTKTQIKLILTSTAVYVSEPSLTSQLGKQWVKIELSALPALAGTSGAGLAQFVQSLHSNNFVDQARLITVAKNTRVVGTQTIDGSTTTEYAGSFAAAAALKALPASLRALLGPALQTLGNGTIHFREWIDGQHHLRKMTEVEAVNGATITTTINVTKVNQPVSVTLPPASQTVAMPGSSPVGGKPVNADLRGKIVPAPPGFVLSSQDNGPMNAAKFNSYMGANLAASLGFVRGYTIFYDGISGDSIEVMIFQFATPGDAATFKAGWDPGVPVTSKANPGIPGAEDYDSTSPDQGTYDHGVIASKGIFTFVIDDLTGTAAKVPLLQTMARQQYDAL